MKFIFRAILDGIGLFALIAGLWFLLIVINQVVNT